jgi:hypothetical protein
LEYHFWFMHTFSAMQLGHKTRPSCISEDDNKRPVVVSQLPKLWQWKATAWQAVCDHKGAAEKSKHLQTLRLHHVDRICDLHRHTLQKYRPKLIVEDDSVSQYKVKALALELNSWCDLQEYHTALVGTPDLRHQRINNCTQTSMSNRAMPVHFIIQCYCTFSHQPTANTELYKSAMI